MALGFAGIVMAAAFLLGARALVLDLVLEPACTAACAEVGLEMAGMSSPGAGIRSSWKSPDTCSCRVGDRTQPPPTCRGDSTVSYDCDAGFWFGGGRWILSGLVNGLFLLGLASPFLIWGLVSLVQRRRRRAHHG